MIPDLGHETPTGDGTLRGDKGRTLARDESRTPFEPLARGHSHPGGGNLAWKGGTDVSKFVGGLAVVLAAQAVGGFLAVRGVIGPHAPGTRTSVALGGVAPSTAAQKAASDPQRHKVVHLLLTVKPGGMLHHPGWPEIQANGHFSPTFRLPAHATVMVKIVNYDNGVASPPKIYGSVTGLVGNQIQVDGALKSAIPVQDIAHTFTVTALGLNVPIEVVPSGQKQVVETFTFVTKGPGTLTWQCMAPCGSGPAGWGGPMVKAGYMTGSIVVG